jgi:hypothetical protein
MIIIESLSKRLFHQPEPQEINMFISINSPVKIAPGITYENPLSL